MLTLIRSLIALFLIQINSATNESPIGQYSSITTVSGRAFMIYNAGDAIQGIYCDDSTCLSRHTQFITCGNLYSSAIITTDYESSQKSKIIYYIIIGYGHENVNQVTLIMCYNYICNKFEQVIIDSSSDIEHVFGYSISLTTYTFNQFLSLKYPMFTYSKFSNTLNQYILNAIICLDFNCTSWIGQSINPPYVALGNNHNYNSLAKGTVSIQEIWSGGINHAAIMFANITNTSGNNFTLTIGCCSLSAAGVVKKCINLNGTELQSTQILNQPFLKNNHITMVQYANNSSPQLSRQIIPLFIASYVVNVHNSETQYDELWLLYCFNIFCISKNQTFYSIHKSNLINYPQINLSKTNGQLFPQILYFENSTFVMLTSCEYDSTPWNCTLYSDNHPTSEIYHNEHFNTKSMQISGSTYSVKSKQSNVAILFSMSSNTIFNGSTYIYCQDRSCGTNSQTYLDPAEITQNGYLLEFDIIIMSVIAALLSTIVILIVFYVYNFFDAVLFNDKYLVHHKGINNTSVKSSNLRLLSCCVLILISLCCVICVMSWYMYGYSDIWWLMIVFTLAPVVISMILILTLSIQCRIACKYKILMVICILYWIVLMLLCYILSITLNIKNKDTCKQDNKLNVMRIICILCIVLICLVMEYLFLWCLKYAYTLQQLSEKHRILLQHQNINNMSMNDKDIVKNDIDVYLNEDDEPEIEDLRTTKDYTMDDDSKWNGLYEKKDVNDWNVNDVIVWIKSVRNGAFEQYEDILKVNEVGGKDLSRMNDKNLKKLGVTRFGDRLDIMEEIQFLVGEGENAEGNQSLSTRIIK